MIKRYRLLCVFITLLLFLWVIYPARWSAVRLSAALVDCIVSIAYYCVTVAGFDGLITPTVNRIPDVPYAPLIPMEPEKLKEILHLTWQRLFVGENFLNYLVRVGDILRKPQ